MICFEDSIQNGTEDLELHGRCYKACKRIQYGLIVAENVPMTDSLLNFESYGEEFVKYFLQPNKLLGFLGYGYVYNQEEFLKQKLEKTSLIHINFEGAEALTVTKDAKITLPDMIGNIGGTLGVFIGFSFIGVLDDLMEFLQYLRRKMRKKYSLKKK